MTVNQLFRDFTIPLFSLLLLIKRSALSSSPDWRCAINKLKTALKYRNWVIFRLPVNSVKSKEETQLLPGFVFWSPNPNQCQAMDTTSTFAQHSDEYPMCLKDRPNMFHDLIDDKTGVNPPKPSYDSRMSSFLAFRSSDVRISMLNASHKDTGQFFVFTTVDHIIDRKEFTGSVYNAVYNDKSRDTPKNESTTKDKWVSH